MAAVKRAAAMMAIGAALAVAPAPAAAWIEPPPYEIPGHGIATCLRDAGDGRIAVLGPLGRTTTPTDVLEIRGDGLARAGRVTLGWLDACAAAVGAGPTVMLAGPVRQRPPAREPVAVHVAATDQVTARVGAATPAAVTSLDVAVAPSGAAVVAWTEQRPDRLGDRPARVLASVRPAGTWRFARPTVLGRARAMREEPLVSAGIDDDGRATVAWRREGGRDLGVPTVDVVTSDVRGRFARPQRLARDGGATGAPALDVAADGRALLAFAGPGAVRAFERRPGGARFEPIRLDGAEAWWADEIAVDVADDGGAVIAWRGGRGSVGAALRAPGTGAFATEQV
ncbi:MAG TPA: hypothetical protein VFR97_05945, partial [Capillimicrobium sp.]|nr:hypothetical protein [Capillimicrobium sp.]